EHAVRVELTHARNADLRSPVEFLEEPAQGALEQLRIRIEEEDPARVAGRDGEVVGVSVAAVLALQQASLGEVAVDQLLCLAALALRQSAKVWGTYLLAPLERRKAKRLTQTRPLLLHLGSGAHRLPGWVNVDLVGMGPDLRWDLTRRLPFPDASAQAVFVEHVL